MNRISLKTPFAQTCLLATTVTVVTVVLLSASQPSKLLADEPMPPQRPNIVLVMADDQGWGQTSYNGHPDLMTPNLDKMAESGLRFNRFYAAAPVCSPTRAAVLTGRTPFRTGVPSHGFPLRRQEKTLAQAMQLAGYATGHFGKWHLNGLRGPGVPIFPEDKYRPDVFGFQKWVSVSNFFDMDPIMSRMGTFEEFKGDSSEIIVDEALKFIEASAKADQPSFTVIWYGTPHNPFRASAEDTAPFEHLKNDSKNQLGELVAMDRSIGTLRKGLREHKLADNTILWFTSDNGGLPKMAPSTVGPLRGHKGNLYEGGLRVPTIIEWPKELKPRVTDFPAVSMDIVPTIAEIIGLDRSSWIEPQDGISLTNLFRGELKSRGKPIPFHFGSQSALIDNQYKIVQSPKKKKQPAFELFDLATDPTEKVNLAESHPELLARMKQLLKENLASVRKSQLGLDYPSKKVDADHAAPRRWNETETYREFLKKWGDRWEYSKLKPKSGNKKKQ